MLADHGATEQCTLEGASRGIFPVQWGTRTDLGHGPVPTGDSEDGCSEGAVHRRDDGEGRAAATAG